MQVMSGHSDLGLEIQVIYPRGPGASKTEGNMTNTHFWTWRVFNFLTLKPKMKANW